MKNLLFLLIMFLLHEIGVSQVYHVNYRIQDDHKLIKIRIDTNWMQGGVFVEKTFVPFDESSSSLETEKQNSLILLGNYQIDSNGIGLDYTNFQYYWIPFNPATPFFNVNMLVPNNVISGSIYFDYNMLNSRAPGDFIYWCNCSGISEGPGGCVSNLTGTVIQCVDDDGCEGTESNNYCIGKAVIHQKSFIEGGVFIKVNKEKNRLIHNFNTQ